MLQFRWSRATAVGIFLLAFLVVLLDATGDVTKTSNKKKEVRIRNKREGSWSGWSSWSPCSRTCGGGIRTQTRQCQIRRGKGKSKEALLEESKLWKNVSSRHCEGHATRHHLCNTQECPKDSIDFRESQCKAFDNRPFMGKVYQWEAFIDERSPCSLTCRAKGFRFFATLNKSVIDGTNCKSNPFDLHVCVSGSCTPIGCDGIAGSQRRLDRCGVCGGDNSTCRVVSGIFTRPQLPVGYNMVAHIPKGACNLNITQLMRSPNYLALRTNDGSFILNGNWAISWPGEYEGAGAKFVYTRQDLQAHESIASPGPLREPVDLLVLYQQPNHGIKYEYMLPMNDAPIPPIPAEGIGSSLGNRPLTAAARPDPRSYSGSAPSNLLLPGTTNTVASFIPKPSALSSPGTPLFLSGESPAYSISGTVVSKTNNPQTPHPHLHHHQGRRRNHVQNRGGHSKGDTDKKFTWKITGYSNCSEPCGGGTQRSVIRCVRAANGVPVSDRRCQADEKPLGQTIRCNLKPCPAEWITGPWSACSEVCGPDGYQTRTVHCQQRVSPTLTMRVAEGACLDKQPESRKMCSNKPCHRWETTAWSQCSAQCGNGIRSRKVTCTDSLGDKIESSNCDQTEKPLEISACNMGPCEGVDWFTSEWSNECSQTCGSGFQSRHVVCGGLQNKQRRGSSETETNLVEDDGLDDSTVVNDFACDSSKKPSDERECFTEKHCGEPNWFAGPWGQCSVSCGQGLKSRQVLCILFNRGKFKVIEDSHCSAFTKPDEKTVCENPNSCRSRWFTTEWSECSAPCGGGSQRRSVSCRASNWTLTSSACLDEDRPLDRRSCNEHKCTGNSGSNTDQSGMVKDTPPAFQAEPTVRSSTNTRVNSQDESRPQASALTASQSRTASQPTLNFSNSEPNEEPDDSECTDQYRNCPLVVQARLCRYKYYRSVCCSACTENWQAA